MVRKQEILTNVSESSSRTPKDFRVCGLHHDPIHKDRHRFGNKSRPVLNPHDAFSTA